MLALVEQDVPGLDVPVDRTLLGGKPRLAALSRKGDRDVLRAVDPFPRAPITTAISAKPCGKAEVSSPTTKARRFGRSVTQEGKAFPGLVIWAEQVYDQMSYGDIIAARVRVGNASLHSPRTCRA